VVILGVFFYEKSLRAAITGVNKGREIPGNRGFARNAAQPASEMYKSSIGQAFTQIPQAIHLEGVSRSGALTTTLKGHASTHVPQPTHLALLIIYTPLGFCVIASEGHALAQAPHCAQTFGLTPPFLSIMRTQDNLGSAVL
jgi:hypothetical protein